MLANQWQAGLQPRHSPTSKTQKDRPRGASRVQFPLSFRTADFRGVIDVGECLGDLSPTEAGIRVGEQIMGVERPVWPFLVNLPA
jgi:hypothetical protein